MRDEYRTGKGDARLTDHINCICWSREQGACDKSGDSFQNRREIAEFSGVELL